MTSCDWLPMVTMEAVTRELFLLSPLMAAAISCGVRVPSASLSAAVRSIWKLLSGVAAASGSPMRTVREPLPAAGLLVRPPYDVWLAVASCCTKKE
ncbi:hypothetical protein D3C81_1949580 [compost metagenome]